MDAIAVSTSTPPVPARGIKSARLEALPPFLFNEIDNRKRAALAAGKDVINLGVGDPDRPTPGFVIEAMDRAMRVPANHQYPDCWGTREFLEAAAEFMLRRFGVACDPKKHILATIGGKDGIAHLPLGVVNPGDGVIVFTPAYPVYAGGAVLAGGVVQRIATSAATNWLPEFTGAHAAELERAGRVSRLLWLNYPGNPTGAAAGVGVYREAVAFAARHDLIVASDLAYSELYLGEGDAGRALVPSLWQEGTGARLNATRGIEFHSLSKTFNMTGWRIGFAVGHEEVIGALRQVKDNVDSGVFNAIQSAGAAALRRFDDPEIGAMRQEYAARARLVVEGLRAIGCAAEMPSAGIFVWARCPVDRETGAPMDSWKFAIRLIDEVAVVTVPGAGFGATSADWFRVSLTRETGRIREAMERVRGMGW
ncbi:LL-diaminopimelate aminotransferase [soil metagenome]